MQWLKSSSCQSSRSNYHINHLANPRHRRWFLAIHQRHLESRHSSRRTRESADFLTELLSLPMRGVQPFLAVNIQHRSLGFRREAHRGRQTSITALTRSWCPEAAKLHLRQGPTKQSDVFFFFFYVHLLAQLHVSILKPPTPPPGGPCPEQQSSKAFCLRAAMETAWVCLCCHGPAHSYRRATIRIKAQGSVQPGGVPKKIQQVPRKQTRQSSAAIRFFLLFMFAGSVAYILTHQQQPPADFPTTQASCPGQPPSDSPAQTRPRRRPASDPEAALATSAMVGTGPRRRALR